MTKILALLTLLLTLNLVAQPSTRLSDALFMNNNFDIVKFKIIDNNVSNTLPWLEFGSQTNPVFSLPKSGIVPLSNLGFQTTTNVTGADGLWTNSFSPVFSTAPRVFITPKTHTVTNFVVSVTTSNVVTKSDANVTN